MKTRNILLRFLNHLPNGNKEKIKDMNEMTVIKRKSPKETRMENERNDLPDEAARMRRGAEKAQTRMMAAAKAAAQMMPAAKAALLIILIVALPLIATSCRDRDDEPSAGGKLITVSRLRVSIDEMQSVAEMKAGRSAEMKAVRSAEMKAVRNEALAGGGGEIRHGAQPRDGGEIRGGGEIRNSGNTRANTSDSELVKNGYVGVVKTEFVEGDVLHFMVTMIEDDLYSGIRQVSNATLQADGTWLFDTPLVLPEEPTETSMIEVFYDGTKRRYTYYNDSDTEVDNTADDGNAYAAYWDAKQGTKDGATNLTTYPDMLYVWDYNENWTDITLTPDGTLTLPFEHNNSLVRISSIDNRLGAEVTAIHAKTTDGITFASVSLYPAATTTSSGAASSAADASAATANGTVEAIIGSTEGSPSILQSFTVTLADGHEIIVPVPKDEDDNDRELHYNKSYSYRLRLLPGSFTAEEDNGIAPTYQVRRDLAVPAGYIPIYTAEDLRKIGQKDGNNYLPAIVNGYLYTNASSALLAADAQKDPIYDPATGAYTDSGYSEAATNAAIAAGGIAPGAAATSDGSITKPDGSSNIGPLTFSLDARYILMNDIDLTPKGEPAVDKDDLSGIDGITSGLWTPIGKDRDNPFTGRFHGNGFTIRGMTIKGDAEYLGLFGYTKGAVIYNVHLQDARVKGTTQSNGYFGSLVGYCQYSTISSCSATGCALQGSGSNAIVGGLVGGNDSGTLTHCHATACSTLSNGGNFFAGGLVGLTNGILTSCYTAGCTASCTDDDNTFGGLVGINWTTIYGCYATYAKVIKGTGNFGSLVGDNSYSIIASSYAINATDSKLGLVGNNYDGTITACVSPFESAGSIGGTSNTPGNDDNDDGQDNGGGYYWKITPNGDDPYSGGYAPLTDTDFLKTLDGNPSFTTEGNLADVRTLLVNSGSTDITDKDMGGGDDGGNITFGKLKTIPPGGLYTVKREWTATGIWGDKTAPKGPTIVLPRINWTYNGEEKN